MTDERQPPAEPARADPDAIIFISGLGHEWSDQSIDGFAKRIVNAFNVNAKTAGAQFRVLSGREEEYGEGLKTNMRTISRKDGPREVPIADVYEMDYTGSLTTRYEDRNLLMKCLLLAMALISGLFRFRKALSRKRAGKELREKLQIAYAMVILALLSFYMVILLFAVAGTISSAMGDKDQQNGGTQSSVPATTAGSTTAPPTTTVPSTIAPSAAPPTTTAPATSVPIPTTPTTAASTPAVPTTAAPAATAPAPSSRGNTGKPGQAGHAPADPWSVQWAWQHVLSIIDWLTGFAPYMVVILAAFGLVLPDFKRQLSKAAVGYLCMIYYLSLGERRNAILGQLTALLEHVAEKEGTPYRNIHIVAFSFGTIVALDGLFPTGRLPEERFKKINGLVTIGCPYDLVRTFWDEYFSDRKALPDVPGTWLNVFSPVDVLASNFRDDDHVNKKPDQGIRVKREEAPEQPPRNLVPENIPYLEAINPKTLQWLDRVLLIGLRAHSMYWGREFESEANCFNQVIARLYRGDDALK